MVERREAVSGEDIDAERLWWLFSLFNATSSSSEYAFALNFFFSGFSSFLFASVSSSSCSTSSIGWSADENRLALRGLTRLPFALLLPPLEVECLLLPRLGPLAEMLRI